MKKFNKLNANDNWIRNMRYRSEKADDTHPTINALESFGNQPKKVLEIGCSSGFVLEAIRQKYGSKCFGIELGKKAIIAGKKKFPKINIYHGSWNLLSKSKTKYDLIICGFFIFVLDPVEVVYLLTSILDRTEENGLVLIYDFKALSRVKRKYKHSRNVFSFKYPVDEILSKFPGVIHVFKKTYNYQLNIDKMTEVNIFLKTNLRDFLVI